jgi:hypothetical protein
VSRAEPLVMKPTSGASPLPKNVPPKPSPFKNRRGKKRKTDEKKSRQSRGKPFAKPDLPRCADEVGKIENGRRRAESDKQVKDSCRTPLICNSIRLLLSSRVQTKTNPTRRPSPHTIHKPRSWNSGSLLKSKLKLLMTQMRQTRCR